MESINSKGLGRSSIAGYLIGLSLSPPANRKFGCVLARSDALGAASPPSNGHRLRVQPESVRHLVDFAKHRLVLGFYWRPFVYSDSDSSCVSLAHLSAQGFNGDPPQPHRLYE